MTKPVDNALAPQTLESGRREFLRNSAAAALTSAVAGAFPSGVFAQTAGP